MKFILSTFFILTLAIFCFPQKSTVSNPSVPDFTGTWVLDKNKSGPGGVTGSSQIYVDITLVIEHIDPEIKIVQTIKSGDGQETVQTINIFTDQRRKPVRGKNDNNNFVMYEWKGKTLEKTAKFVIGRGEGWDWFLDKNKTDSLQMENKEEWKLSKDGKTLTQKTTGGTAPGVPSPSAFKYVYRRQN